HGDAESAAQSGEPFEFLAVFELRDHRGVVNDAGERRIADFTGAHGIELGALAGVIQVAFDAGKPVAGKPVVTGLRAADRAVELARSAGREQLRPVYRIAEDGVGLGLAGAIADGAA